MNTALIIVGNYDYVYVLTMVIPKIHVSDKSNYDPFESGKKCLLEKMPPRKNASWKKCLLERMPPEYFVTRKKCPLRKKIISTCKHVIYENYHM